MNRTQIMSLSAIVVVAALVAYLALRNPQPPILPADPDHASFDTAGTCLICHGPDGCMPKSTNHPLGNDCTRCHGYP